MFLLRGRFSLWPKHLPKTFSDEVILKCQKFPGMSFGGAGPFNYCGQICHPESPIFYPKLFGGFDSLFSGSKFLSNASMRSFSGNLAVLNQDLVKNGQNLDIFIHLVLSHLIDHCKSILVNLTI